MLNCRTLIKNLYHISKRLIPMSLFLNRGSCIALIILCVNSNYFSIFKAFTTSRDYNLVFHTTHIVGVSNHELRNPPFSVGRTNLSWQLNLLSEFLQKYCHRKIYKFSSFLIFVVISDWVSGLFLGLHYRFYPKLLFWSMKSFLQYVFFSSIKV